MPWKVPFCASHTGKIVQESSDSQRGLVCTQMQAVVQPAADQHHVLAVLIGGNVPVLDELPHLLHLGVLIVFSKMA